MPKSSRVHKLYTKLKKTHGKTGAAKIAQSVTGKSLKTGCKPKSKK